MIALCMGDPNGIGPECLLKAAGSDALAEESLVLLGPGDFWHQESVRLGLAPPAPWKPGAPAPGAGERVWWCPDSTPAFVSDPGEIHADASAVAMHLVGQAVDGCLAGHFQAMVTGPVCKEGLVKAGYSWPGHTEFLADRCGSSQVGMLLIAEPLRVFLLTRHLPLREVADAISMDLLLRDLPLLCQALPWLGCEEGRVAVCGLNPHAGDGGALGDEELRIIAPAVKQLQQMGWPVEGPFSADTVFYHAARGAYAAVAAMYHDQGLGPLKLLGFEKGVNLTLGLPIIRTSPDHGTAFGIAGKGVADASSTVEAIRLASRLSQQTNPWASSS